MTPEALGRLGSRFTVGDDCWEWTDTLKPDGYGVFGKVGAHRVLYELLVGPIPPGMELDHICHTRDASCGGGATCPHRRCVRPDHLEPVSHRANVLRGRVSAQQSDKTHCPKGHPYDEENTMQRRRSGTGAPFRQCRACHRERWRASAETETP